jgi:hypothetical protein
MSRYSDYTEYIKDKRIVLVGPSPSILTKKQGELIDSYDIVVRIKKAFPVPKGLQKHIGTKTNILCSHLKLNQNNFSNKNLHKLQKRIDWIVSPFPMIKPFDRFHSSFMDFYNDFLYNNLKFKKKPIYTVWNLELYNKHANAMDTTPTTAVAFILDLLQYEFKELYITGITFRLDGYYEQYKTKTEDKESFHRTTIQRPVHNFNKELKYMKPILLNDSRVTYDNTLELILNNK